MKKWNSKNRHKFLLQYHIILVCKYRHKIFNNTEISNDIKLLSNEICDKYDVKIKYLETDKDHIHYMLETPPTISISKIVKLIKSYTTYHIWRSYDDYLKTRYWADKTFWTDGYFACTVGNVSERILKKYIINQG